MSNLARLTSSSLRHLRQLRNRLKSSGSSRFVMLLYNEAQPSTGIIDSQSVKTAGVGGGERGFDGGKKISGRKRHVLVDTQGFLQKIKVYSAAIMDRDGVELLLLEAIRATPTAGDWLGFG